MNKPTVSPRKIVIISRCQDCPLTKCHIRSLCGDIPDKCNLTNAMDSAMTTYEKWQGIPTNVNPS